MATGKTHGRHYRLYLDEVDLSGDARNVDSFGRTFAEEDVTGWSNGIMNFVLGQPDVFITGFQAVFNNATGGSHSELSAREEYLASLAVGIRAAPAAGDPAFCSPLEQGSYVVEGSGPALVSANLNGPGQGFTLPSKVWGSVLYPKTAISATTNGSQVDNGGSTSDGLLAYLHVLSADGGGTWTLKVQHSSSPPTWADLITFSADGQTATAEQGSAAGTVNQYLRFQATDNGAATGATFFCAAVRL